MGFVAHVKGERSNAIIAQGLQDPRQSRPSRRRRRGSDVGRRRRLPDPDSGRPVPRLGRDGAAQPAAARRLCRGDVLPAARRGRAGRRRSSGFERFIRIEGQVLIGWREVPVDADGLGAAAQAAMPVIAQAVVARGAERRRSGRVRAQAARDPQAGAEPARGWRRSGAACPSLPDFYIASFSSRTLVYKGMLLAHQVGDFYRDLADPLTVSALAMVHQRFSTNTFPSWRLAHPYRFIAHNGEINTLRGNVNWMNARRRTLESPLLGADPRQDVADHPARPVRHRLPRQCARAAARRRLFAAARGDAAHPGGLVRHADGAEAARLLRISCGADGAVGRPGGDRLHRRPADRRDARPQRPQARPLPASPTTISS